MSATFVKLGSVAEFINGVAFKPEDWGDSGTKIIRIQNLTDPTKPFNRTNRTVSDKYRVKPHDLLVSWSATLGVFEWFGPDEALLNQHIFRVLPDEKKVEKRYLRYALEGALLDMQRHLHGATMQHVNRGEFINTKLFLPSLPDQRRIADILDRAEALRAKRRAALDQLDELIRSVFIEIFGDPIKNPKKWEEKELKEFGEIITGNTPSREKTEYYGDYIEWIKSDNINTPYTYLTKSEEMLSESGVKVGRTAPTNSVLVTCIAGSLSCIGNAAIADRNVAFNQQINAIVPNENVNTLFLYHLILNTKEYIQNQSTQSMKGMISKGVFGSIPFIMPPIEAQLKFAEFAEKIEKVRAVQNQSLLEINNLFDSLSHEAFTGKLLSHQFFERGIENGVKI